jgi:hypothetical protein
LLLLLLLSLTPTERRLRASIAGATGWSRTADRPGRARHANRGIWERLYRETPADLPEHVRAKMADSGFKAHMQRLAFKSSKARRKRAEQRDELAAERKAARQAERLDGGAA